MDDDAVQEATLDNAEPTPLPGSGQSAPSDESAESTGPAFSRPRTSWREIIRWTVITLIVLGALAGLFFTGRAATTGADSAASDLPDYVQGVIPNSGANVLRQGRIGIDLAEGYAARLTVNGVTINEGDPGLIADPGNGVIQFQPGENPQVPELNKGRNCVIAAVWNRLAGEASAETISWCFTAT